MKILLFLCLLCVSVSGQSQNPPKVITPQPSIASAISLDELLKLSKLAYERSQRTIQMKDAQIAFEKAKAEFLVFDEQIGLSIAELAKAQKVDLTIYYFDLNELKFLERKKREPLK